MFEIRTSITFADSELRGFLSSEDVELLYEKTILPRPNGLDKLTMVKGTFTIESRIEVTTCREWNEAVLDGYHASTTYDMKEEIYFKRVYALVSALAQAKTPEYKYISDQKISLANFELLP